MVLDFLTHFLILMASIIVLAKSSQTVINSAINISKITGLSELVVGFLILSVATTTPELAVSFSAVTAGEVGISIGNILGSNITNLGLILGLVAITAPLTIKIKKKALSKFSLILFFSTLIPLALFLIGGASQLVGFSLVTVFAFFGYYSIKKGFIAKETKAERKLELLEKKKVEETDLKKQAVFLALSILIVIISARLVVYSASNIADVLAIANSIIGATLIALSTSIPELSVSVTAARKGHINLALGDAIGACLTNLTLVLGIVLIIFPFVINMTVYSTFITFAIISSVLLWLFIRDRKFSLKEGIILIFIFILYWLVAYGVQLGLPRLTG